MADPSNWPKWGYDNNDGDVCCADQAAAAKAGHGTSPFGWLVWGASTQGERTMDALPEFCAFLSALQRRCIDTHSRF